MYLIYKTVREFSLVNFKFKVMEEYTQQYIYHLYISDPFFQNYYDKQITHLLLLNKPFIKTKNRNSFQKFETKMLIY